MSILYLGAVISFLILLIYKLEGKTDLTWKWITFPIWGCLGAIIIFLLFLLAIMIVGILVDAVS